MFWKDRISNTLLYVLLAWTVVGCGGGQTGPGANVDSSEAIGTGQAQSAHTNVVENPATGATSQTINETVMPDETDDLQESASALPEEQKSTDTEVTTVDNSVNPVSTSPSTIPAASLYVYTDLENTYVSASFVELDSNVNVTEGYANSIHDDIDTCDVSSLGFSEEETDTDEVFLDAGERITISNQFGTAGSLTRSTLENGALWYSMESPLDGNPSGLSIDLLAGFPFKNARTVQLSQPPLLELVSPNLENAITRNTQFKWQSDYSPNSSIHIYVQLQGKGIGYRKIIKHVRCKVANDGEFSFPSSVKQLIGVDVPDAPNTEPPELQSSYLALQLNSYKIEENNQSVIGFFLTHGFTKLWY